jgi:hypothetical protein
MEGWLSKSSLAMILRAIAVWILIISVETVHGVLRTILLTPWMGDIRARQLSVFTGCILIFMVSYFLTAWIGAKTKKHLLAVGALWVAFTVLFEIALGRMLLALPWNRITEDYDLSRGGFLGFGLVFMAVTPILVARFRRITPFI